MLENAPCRDGIPHITDSLDFQCLPLPAQLLQISRLRLRDRVLLFLFLGLLDKQLFQLGVRLGFALPGLFLVFLPLFFLVLGSAAGTRRPFLCRLFRDNCRRVGGRFRRAGGRMIQVALALYSCLSCLEDAFLFCLAFESSCIGTHGKASRSLSRAGVSHRAVWIFAYILYAIRSKEESAGQDGKQAVDASSSPADAGLPSSCSPRFSLWSFGVFRGAGGFPARRKMQPGAPVHGKPLWPLFPECKGFGRKVLVFSFCTAALFWRTSELERGKVLTQSECSPRSLLQ